MLPSKFRDDLAGTFIVTRGLEECMYIYTIEAWQALEEKMNAMPTSDENIRNFIRYYFGGAYDMELDKQGRIQVPPVLREHAILTKEVVSVGTIKRVEIWAKEKWEENNFNILTKETKARLLELGF